MELVIKIVEGLSKSLHSITRVIREAMPNMLLGMGMTVRITAVSLAIAITVGLLACLMGMSRNKLLSGLSKFYIWLIRGTPLLVQAMYIYYAFPQFVQGFVPGFRLATVTAGVVTLSLNAGAYISEIFRGGIQAVDPGQMEAARSLGLSQGRAMRRVILPQAIRICSPSLVNQFIITLKDSSIISTVGLAELVYFGKMYIGRTMESFGTWTVIGALYLIVISSLTFLTRYLERRFAIVGKT